MAYHLTIRDLLACNVARSPHATALIAPEQDLTLSFRELEARAHALAGFLSDHKVGPGDRVAFFLTDAVELPITIFACALIGAIFVPINFRLSVDELAYILNDCTPRALIFDREGALTVERAQEKFPPLDAVLYTGTDELSFAQSFGDITKAGPKLLDELDIAQDSAACILYTSGTTGHPKGVVHTHYSFIESARAWTHAAGLTTLSVSLALGPLCHVGGLLANFMPTFYMGGSNVIQKNFDPTTIFGWLAKYEIDVMWATPTHINMMVSAAGNDPPGVSNLKAIQYSGAPIHLELLNKVRGVFGEANLINAYGMTELVGVSCVYPAEHDDHLGSVGRPLPGNFVKLVDPMSTDQPKTVKRGQDGMIMVRSPCLMKEYWNLPDKTREVVKGGWYATGDLGRMDEDGYIYFLEREDDMIISGGENIYPLEVENAIFEHQKVHSVAVVGSPHPKWGEAVVAYVVKSDQTLTEQELDEHCLHNDKLANFKRPRIYRFIEQLPVTSSGKVDRKQLRN